MNGLLNTISSDGSRAVTVTRAPNSRSSGSARRWQ
jgi:hypothetical protein